MTAPQNEVRHLGLQAAVPARKVDSVHLLEGKPSLPRISA